MPTEKRRLNISLTKEIDQALTQIAQRDNVAQATKAIELLKKGLEIEEDTIWDSIANTRDSKNAKFVSHKKAWA
jgi:hypothetical protein